MIYLFISCTSSNIEEQQLLSSEEVGEAIEVAVEGLLRVDPILMHYGWTSSMNTLSNEVCPPMEEHNGMDLWRNSCTTEEGHQFLGWSLNFRGNNIPSECCTFENFYWLSGQAQIIHSDGTLLQNFGDILHKEGQDQDGNKVIEGFTYGDFYWEDPLAENTWLQSELSMEYYYTFTKTETYDYVDIQAWISNFSPIYPAAIFESVIFNTEECEKEPTEGEIWIRDIHGIWYTIIYDSDSSCDGCGSLYQGETLIGQTCASFDQLFSWQEYPWENQ
jgi:hypothetical protein